MGRYSASIVANTTTARFRRLTMYTSVQTMAIGMMAIDQVSTRLVSGVGFSYGCAEFGPKYPPPLVPSCLIETTPAVTPRAIVCAGPSTVVAWAAPSKVIGVPCHITMTETSERQRQEDAEGRARHVHVEVAERRQPVSRQAANRRDARGDAGRRRDELQET